MAETITARAANQGFSRLLRQVSEGREFIITNRGTPVAVLSPAPGTSTGRRELTADQERALKSLTERALANQVADDAEPITPFDRDAIYDERIPRRLRDLD
jgi:prevent-host-death family protein